MDSANTIVFLGIDLLEDINWAVQDQITSESIVSKEVITHREPENYYQAKKYRLTSVIPLLENPKKVVRELTQEQLDEFLDGHHEYANLSLNLWKPQIMTNKTLLPDKFSALLQIFRRAQHYMLN